MYTPFSGQLFKKGVTRYHPKYPNPISQIRHQTQKSLADMKASMSAEEYAIKSVEMESQKEMFMNPIIQFFVMGLTVFLIGIVTSVLSSFALKKEPSLN